jgi:hypothetical protein
LINTAIAARPSANHCRFQAGHLEPVCHDGSRHSDFARDENNGRGKEEHRHWQGALLHRELLRAKLLMRRPFLLLLSRNVPQTGFGGR